MKKFTTVIGLASAGALACVGAVGLATSAAFASSGAQHAPAAGMNLVTGPPPVALTNCPSFLSAKPVPPATSTWSLDFTSGNAVMYGTSNKNGDWGGGNAEGQAQLTNGSVVEYSGHAHIWFGGGQNSVSTDPTLPPTNQAEQGFTLTFHGSGAAGSIDISANMHMTQNNNGQSTANVQNINVTCS